MQFICEKEEKRNGFPNEKSGLSQWLYFLPVVTCSVLSPGHILGWFKYVHIHSPRYNPPHTEIKLDADSYMYVYPLLRFTFNK